MPLPNPNSNESRGDFVDRCVIDNNIVNDFNTIQQRIAVCNSLYEQEKQIKQVKDTWQSAFENELTKAERSSNRDFYLYYQAEYDKAIKMFLSQGGISTADVQVFFKEDTLIKMYSEMYAKVGLQFARWYSKNFDKFISKSVNLKDYESIWQANFAFIGSQVGGQRVSGVSGTAKQTIISVIQKLMKDPEFQIQGERVKARILKSQFTQYSTYQARRVVRTESTNAANYATFVSAQDIFPGQDMQKMWMAGRDARVRPAHQAAHRQVVDYNKPFIVGGEQLKWPGDPAGSASNVINCRCSFAPIPKPNAQTIGENITDIGFNLARNTIQSEIGGALITPEVAATIAVETQQVQTNISNAKTIKEAEQWAKDNGLANIVDYSGFDVESANKINNTLKMVFDDFGVDPLAQIVPGKYKGESGALASANGYDLTYNKNKYSKAYIKESFDRNVTNFRKGQEERLINYENFRGFLDDKKINKGIRETKKSLLYNRHNVFTSEEEFIENVFIHESGHMIEDQLLARINGTRLLQNRFIEGQGYLKTYNDSVRILRNEYEGIYASLTQQEKSLISAYGATDSSETLCESLVMYYKEPNKIPISLKNFFDKLKQHGKR